jgi:hypothetical protein
MWLLQRNHQIIAEASGVESNMLKVKAGYYVAGFYFPWRRPLCHSLMLSIIMQHNEEIDSYLTFCAIETLCVTQCTLYLCVEKK